MKQLLTILLLFPLFIACSSDDDDKKDEGMTDAQKEAFLVGQWSSSSSAPTLYQFFGDKTFKYYRIETRTQIRLIESGIYSVKTNDGAYKNRIYFNNGSTTFGITDDNTVTIANMPYQKDTKEYTEMKSAN